jgi:hypothetical protein
MYLNEVYRQVLLCTIVSELPPKKKQSSILFLLCVFFFHFKANTKVEKRERERGIEQEKELSM